MTNFKKGKPEVHPKGWGKELWIANSEKYCGKILCFDKGKMCSWHYHDIKDEVFYVLKGRIELLVSFEDDLMAAEKLALSAGDTFHVPAGLRHRMIAVEDTELLEVSTEHFEKDSIRIVRGD